MPDIRLSGIKNDFYSSINDILRGCCFTQCGYMHFIPAVMPVENYRIAARENPRRITVKKTAADFENVAGNIQIIFAVMGKRRTFGSHLYK
jgi:hypothetical protein